MMEESDDRQMAAARHRMEEDKRLAAMCPLARNIERIDAELKCRIDSMKRSFTAKPEDARAVRDLSQALATLMKAQSALVTDA